MIHCTRSALLARLAVLAVLALLARSGEARALREPLDSNAITRLVTASLSTIGSYARESVRAHRLYAQAARDLLQLPANESAQVIGAWSLSRGSLEQRAEWMFVAAPAANPAHWRVGLAFNAPGAERVLAPPSSYGEAQLARVRDALRAMAGAGPGAAIADAFSVVSTQQALQALDARDGSE